jgi:hypothetical protein
MIFLGFDRTLLAAFDFDRIITGAGRDAHFVVWLRIPCDHTYQRNPEPRMRLDHAQTTHARGLRAMQRAGCASLYRREGRPPPSAQRELDRQRTQPPRPRSGSRLAAR